MSSVPNFGNANPYAFVVDDDDQPYFAHGAVMPWEKAIKPAKGPPDRKRVDIDVRQQEMHDFARAVRTAPSGNPYAYVSLDDASPSQLSYENPYRLINDDDGVRQPYFAAGEQMPWSTSRPHDQSHRLQSEWTKFFAKHRLTGKRARQRHSDTEIEALARGLQVKLWGDRGPLFGGTDDPIKVLDPEVPLKLAGFDVQQYPWGMGRETKSGRSVDVVGLLDPINKIVGVSTSLAAPVSAFTLAHELGHVMLGSAGAVVHRDRAINGTIVESEWTEREANRFAAHFLMPSKYLRTAFVRRFLTDRFALTDDAAFALRQKWADEVRKEFPSLRDLTEYLAIAEQFNGKDFSSLASAFNVSPTAMAIRLEELCLVTQEQ